MNMPRLAVNAVAAGMASETAFRAAIRPFLFVFNYHEVTDSPSQFARDFNLAVTPDMFRRQVGWIKKYFDVLNPDQLLAGTFSPPAALITFDDGSTTIFTTAAPILRHASAPATVFMNMAAVQGDPFWSGLVTFLCLHSEHFARFVAQRRGAPMPADYFLQCTRSEVTEFFARLGGGGDVVAAARRYYGEFPNEAFLSGGGADGLYLGNHLFNHYNATQLTQQELAEQYTLNQRALSQYPNSVPLFSYPFGQPRSCYSRATDEQLFLLGAARVFTAFPLFNAEMSARRIHRLPMFDYINSERRFRSQCLVLAALNHVLRRRRWANV